MTKSKKNFEFQLASAEEGYRMFNYETQQPYYIPYEELKRDPGLFAKLLKKEMHRFTSLWNKSILSEEILHNLAKAAEEAGLEIRPINDLVANTIGIKQKKNESQD